jgi:hypothetical protein
VKRSGRDEPIKVVIHMCMKETLRISLYSYLYLTLAKMLCLFYYLYVFSSTKLEKRTSPSFLPGSEGEGGKRNGWRARGKDGPNNVCTYE